MQNEDELNRKKIKSETYQTENKDAEMVQTKNNKKQKKWFKQRAKMQKHFKNITNAEMDQTENKIA